MKKIGQGLEKSVAKSHFWWQVSDGWEIIALMKYLLLYKLRHQLSRITRAQRPITALVGSIKTQ